MQSISCAAWAQKELTKAADEYGVPTTCNVSHLPYRVKGTQKSSRELADMITLYNAASLQSCVQTLTSTEQSIL